MTPDSGYSNTRHDLKPDYAGGDTFPTYLSASNGSASYFEFNGKTDALVTQTVAGSRVSIADVGIENPNKGSSVSAWVKDVGTVLSNLSDGGTGSNQAHSKIWSFAGDKLALEENQTSVTMAMKGGLKSGGINNPYVSTQDVSGSIVGITQPGSVFMYAGITETDTGSFADSSHSLKYVLLISAQTLKMGGATDSPYTFSDYNGTGTLTAPTSSAGVTGVGDGVSLYEHIGSPVSGSKIKCIDHARPTLTYEFTVKEVGDVNHSSGSGEDNKFLVLDETCLVNGNSTPFSGSTNSPHGTGAFSGAVTGDESLLTVNLDSKSDNVQIYENGHSNVVENSIISKIESKDGWKNYTIVSKTSDQNGSAGKNIKIYKNGFLIQSSDGVGRFIGDGSGSGSAFILGKSSTVAKSYWKGKLGHIAVYNKELTAQDVKQNWYALKDRFIGK
jgi:hypothetical protein